MTAKRKETGAAYLRVGTTIYKRVQQPLSSGRSIEILLAWNVETLRQDFGKDYLARIPKYDGFCTVPDHTNYRREIHGFLNRYEPIPFQPAEGDFPHIRGFLSIFPAPMRCRDFLFGLCAIATACKIAVSEIVFRGNGGDLIAKTGAGEAPAIFAAEPAVGFDKRSSYGPETIV